MIKNNDQNTDAKPNSNQQTNPNDYKDYLRNIDSFLNESKEKLKNLESKWGFLSFFSINFEFN